MENSERELKEIQAIRDDMGLSEEDAKQELREQEKAGGRVILLGIGLIVIIVYFIFF